MATENQVKPSNAYKNNRKRKQYLPHNRPVKKGSYPLRPGVEGFFITCDGGREYQASNEAINVIDSFYEELVEGTGSIVEQPQTAKKPLNKITKFSSNSSSDDDDEGEKDQKVNTGQPNDGDDVQTKEDKNGNVTAAEVDVSDEPGLESKVGEAVNKQTREDNEKSKIQEAEGVEPPVKKQHIESQPDFGNVSKNVVKSVDKLIEEELAELGDKSKRRFTKLDSGCNGVIFIQMRRRDGDPSPKDIVLHMMSSLASTKKHVSRFLLRVLPIEVACYTSEGEIKQAIKPLTDKYFPIETETPQKFAVIYDARANTGIDRQKVIDAVAKSVPSVHKVNLANPDLTIVVQIVKTVCLIGVVEKYKELAKYNLRQLTSSKP